jgi:hypothetical protein
MKQRTSDNQSGEVAMSHGASTLGARSNFGGDSFEWVQALPDGAISVERQDETLVLRASQQLQQQFENLLERRKSSKLTAEESDQYNAICELDDALSWLNRLIRSGS